MNKNKDFEALDNNFVYTKHIINNSNNSNINDDFHKINCKIKIKTAINFYPYPLPYDLSTYYNNNYNNIKLNNIVNISINSFNNTKKRKYNEKNKFVIDYASNLTLLFIIVTYHLTLNKDILNEVINIIINYKRIS